MNDSSLLPNIINDFESRIHGDENSRKRTIELAHKIDKYLQSYSINKTPVQKLKKIRDALSEANLPLTSFIFQQEAKIHIKNRYKPPQLQVSQPVSISISDAKVCYKKSGSQCDIAKQISLEQKNKHIRSLQEIREELAYIQQEHRIWKTNRKIYIENQRVFDARLKDLKFDIKEILDVVYSQ